MCGGTDSLAANTACSGTSLVEGSHTYPLVVMGTYKMPVVADRVPGKKKIKLKKTKQRKESNWRAPHRNSNQ